MNSNMLSRLPASLANDGRADTLLTLMMGDDVNADVWRIASIMFHLLLSDPAARGLSADRCIEPGLIEPWDLHHIYCTSPPTPLYTILPEKGIDDRIELRLNNILLGRPVVEKGWLVFMAEPKQFALGRNLLGVRVTERPTGVRNEIVIEKLEVHVKYR